MTTPCHNGYCARPADIKVGNTLVLCAHHYKQHEVSR